MTQPPPTSGPDFTSWWNARSVQHLLKLMWSRPPVRLVVYFVLALLALRVLLWSTGVLASVIFTVFMAYALAFLANPMLLWLERHKVSRALGVFLLLFFTVALLAVVVTNLTSQVAGLISGIPQIAQNLEKVLFDLLDRLKNVPGAGGLKDSLNQYISDQTANFQKNAGPFLDRILNSGPSVLSTLSNVLGWFGQAGFIVTLAIYFMFDYDRVGLGLLHVFPRAWQPTLYQLSEDVSESFGGYIRGQLLVMLAGALLAFLGLLVLKVPNSLALGLLSGLISLIPYVGILIAAVIAMLTAIPQGIWIVVAVAVLFFIINQVQGNVVGPIVMGRTVSLSPSAILIGLLIGLALAGAVGAILAIPILTLFKRWMERYWLTSTAYNGLPAGSTQAGLGLPPALTAPPANTVSPAEGTPDGL